MEIRSSKSISDPPRLEPLERSVFLPDPAEGFRAEPLLQKTLRLNADILQYFQTLSSRKHIPYPTLINNTLRVAMEPSGGGIDLKILKKEIRSAVQSALRK